MSSAIASSQAQTITNIAFGIATTGVGVFTLWQGHKVWRMWRHYHCQSTASPDLELGSCEPGLPGAAINMQGNALIISARREPPSLASWSFESATSHAIKKSDPLDCISPLALPEIKIAPKALVEGHGTSLFSVKPSFKAGGSDQENGLQSGPASSRTSKSLGGLVSSTQSSVADGDHFHWPCDPHLWHHCETPQARPAVERNSV